MACALEFHGFRFWSLGILKFQAALGFIGMGLPGDKGVLYGLE